MSDLQEKLALLGKKYAQKLIPRFATIRETMEQLCGQTEPQVETLESLYTIIHKIHGTAGSYGYEQISTSLGHFEKILIPILDKARGGDMSGWNADTCEALKSDYNEACMDTAFPEELKGQLVPF